MCNLTPTFWQKLVLVTSVGLLPMQGHAEWVEWVGDASASATYRHNMNFSEFEADEEEDWALEANGSYGRFYQVAESSRIGLMGRVTGLMHERFEGLDGIIAGIDLVGIHKFGLGPTTPIVRLQLSAETLKMDDDQRDGERRSAGLSFSKRFTDRLDANMGVTYSDRDGHAGAASPILLGLADTDVFKQEQTILSVGSSYLITERLLGNIGYSHLMGDFQTQCPNNIGLAALPALNSDLEAAAADTVFGGVCMYRAEGKVDIYDAGLSYFLDDATSVDLGYKLRSGRAGNLDYTSYDISLSVSLLF